MLLFIFSEKQNLLFPFLLWAALNIISNECANMVNSASQHLLISKPACITVNISFLFSTCRIKMMKADLFSYDLEKTSFRVKNHWQLYQMFYERLCFHSHSLIWRAWIHYQSLHVPRATQLAAWKTRSCGIRWKELAKTVLGQEFGTALQPQ